MIIDDLTDARILVELKNRLSFAEAARSLNIPPATLSRRVARIEQQAGLRLFERTTRSVNVTAAGNVAVAHAEHDPVRCAQSLLQTAGLRLGMDHEGRAFVGPDVGV